VLTAAALAGVALIAAATLAGAWLGWRSLRLPRLSLACAAMLLLVVVIADLLPDAWNALSSTGLPWWPAAGALGSAVVAEIAGHGRVEIPGGMQAERAHGVALFFA